MPLALLALLKLIPGVGSLVQFCVGKFFDAKVALTQARLGVDRDVAVELVKTAATQEHENTTRLGIFASSKLLTVMLISFAVPLVAFEWKVIVWDTMLGWGSTVAIKGQVADWGNTIIYFLFGAPTVIGVGKMWFNRDKTGE